MPPPEVQVKTTSYRYQYPPQTSDKIPIQGEEKHSTYFTGGRGCGEMYHCDMDVLLVKSLEEQLGGVKHYVEVAAAANYNSSPQAPHPPQQSTFRQRVSDISIPKTTDKTTNIGRRNALQLFQGEGGRRGGLGLGEMYHCYINVLLVLQSETVYVCLVV